MDSRKIAAAAHSVGWAAGLTVVILWMSGACNEYDDSLLIYSDAGHDAAVQPDAPDEVIDSTADVESEADASVEPDAPDDAAGQDGAACTITRVDCDGDEGNGCETDLSSDSGNCGNCGHDCLGGACADGACRPFVLASGQSLPSNVAVDDSHLYWTNQVPGGAVMRVPRHGGDAEMVAQFDLPPGGLAVDTTSVFWSESGSPGSVWRMDKSGLGDAGAPVALATAQATSTSVALDSTWVYWTTPGTVRRVRKTGGAVETLASGQETPGGLVAGFGWAFWTNVMGGTVAGIEPSPDAGIQVFASGQAFPTGLTADLGNLYWANHLGDLDGGAPRIMMVARTGMAAPVVLADGQSGPLGVAQSGTYVFWTNNVGGSVMRVLKTGGAPDELASNQQAPSGIAVDSSAVYWANRDDGTVMALAR